MSPIRMERVESAVRVVVAFYEAFNHHDIAKMLSLVSDDIVLESASPSPDGRIYQGKDAAGSFWQDFLTRSPHPHAKIEETISFGIRCIVRLRYESVEQAGNQGHLSGVDMFRVQDGRITELLSYVKG